MRLFKKKEPKIKPSETIKPRLIKKNVSFDVRKVKADVFLSNGDVYTVYLFGELYTSIGLNGQPDLVWPLDVLSRVITPKIVFNEIDQQHSVVYLGDTKIIKVIRWSATIEPHVIERVELVEEGV